LKAKGEPRAVPRAIRRPANQALMQLLRAMASARK
jgi:uncharacterized protein (UPF0147 family)